VDVETLKIKIEKYINSRRNEETKKYTRDILIFLSEKFSDENQGWVRVKEMQAALVNSGDIPFNTQFFRLLDEMTKLKIIERIEKPREPEAPGRIPIYYRLPVICPVSWFMSIDEILELYEIKIEIAKELLKSFGINLDAEIEKRLEKNI
jgi:hypothetical protein